MKMMRVCVLHVDLEYSQPRQLSVLCSLICELVLPPFTNQKNKFFWILLQPAWESTVVTELTEFAC